MCVLDEFTRHDRLVYFFFSITISFPFCNDINQRSDREYSVLDVNQSGKFSDCVIRLYARSANFVQNSVVNYLAFIFSI